MAKLEFFRTVQYSVDLDNPDVRTSLCEHLDITATRLADLIADDELAQTPGLTKWLTDNPEYQEQDWESYPEDPTQREPRAVKTVTGGPQ